MLQLLSSLEVASVVSLFVRMIHDLPSLEVFLVQETLPVEPTY